MFKSICFRKIVSTVQQVREAHLPGGRERATKLLPALYIRPEGRELYIYLPVIVRPIAVRCGSGELPPHTRKLITLSVIAQLAYKFPVY
jgi:hypothetical protein